MSRRLRAHELDLPLRQSTVSDMLGLLDDPTVDIRVVGQRIATEPVLTARLLTLANSPFYGRRDAVNDLSAAVMTVGQTSVRALVLALAVDAILSDDLGLGSDWWDDCLATGATAASLAPHVGTDGGSARGPERDLNGSHMIGGPPRLGINPEGGLGIPDRPPPDQPAGAGATSPPLAGVSAATGSGAGASGSGR